MTTRLPDYPHFTKVQLDRALTNASSGRRAAAAGRAFVAAESPRILRWITGEGDRHTVLPKMSISPRPRGIQDSPRRSRMLGRHFVIADWEKGTTVRAALTLVRLVPLLALSGCAFGPHVL